MLNKIIYYFFGIFASFCHKHKMHFHWQNLNELPTPKNETQRYGSIIKEGRFWWNNSHSEYIIDNSGATRECYFNDTWKIYFSWAAFTHHNGISIHFGTGDNDDELSFSFGIPYIFKIWINLDCAISQWLCKKLLKQYVKGDNSWDNSYRDREIGISFHNGNLWWNLWNSSDLCKSETPWYRRGSVNFIDFVFGRIQYSSIEIESGQILVPMPEKSYIGNYKITLDSWHRTRLPFFKKSGYYANVGFNQDDGQEPIPIPGKGENSWDCGDDALYGMSCKASKKYEVIGECVKSVMRDRIRYGGSETMYCKTGETNDAK